MAISDIILRQLIHPDLITKGSAISWAEEDTNWIEVYDALNNLINTGGTFEVWDSLTEYSEGDFVSYNDNIWEYISASPSTGITPGSNPLVWEITSIGQFAHQQNTDQYLDFGGINEVSAEEIRDFINTGGDLTLWSRAGNTLTSRGVFGSTSGAYGWDFKRNNTVVGGIGNSTGWFWGTNAAYTNTDHSFQGSGNTSGTYNTQWKDSGGTSLGWVRNDGILNATGFNIGGSLFARYSNGSAILQMTPETSDKTGAGSDWIGIGRFAMYAASNPQRVVALGGGVFVDATAWEDSVGLGYRAGYKNITGDRLMYIGPEAGYFNETGSDQIMIGRLATPLSGATNLNGVIVIASGGVVRQSNTGVLGSNDSPISRWVFGRGESETTTFEDVVLTAHYPANNSNQNAGGSIGFAPPAARGTGTSGDLKFYYSPAVASGTTLQTYSEAFKVRGTDGVSIFSKSAKLASYTVGMLPAQETGAIIYVSDESGGAVVAFSDGTNWRRVTDRAIVS